jgi:uncharacterized membrane protein YcaP (DUF421 family)
MDVIYKIFGEGKDLNALQMSMRALLIFILALGIIRIAGRRSFGMKMPFDNIIAILLGAILSRAVVGVSPFWPTVAASAVLALLHRLTAWIAIRNERFGKMLKGNSTLLYKDGVFFHRKMERFQVCEKDVMEEVRIQANTTDMQKIKEIYMEPSGQLSIIKTGE